MIGLDTNVLARYLTQDDPDPSARANRLLETRCARDAPGWIALVVLCELVWVLRGAYRYEKSQVVEVLEWIMATVELEIEDEDVARQALSAYRKGGADFADYVILYGAGMAGCETLYSFDRRLAGQKGVSMP